MAFFSAYRHGNMALLSEKEESVFNRAFGQPMAKRGGILPPFEVVKHNGSLLLGNSHFSTGQTFRLPLNNIQIAGYQEIKNRKPLTKHGKLCLVHTTGDLQSFREAVHFAVPIIGILILEDQFNNIDKAVNKGFGKKADIMDIKALKAVMDDVIRNTKYRQSAEELSLIYFDRPIPPGNELLFWIEHVIRTKGALHLRSRRS